MEGVDILGLLAELKGEYCELNHGTDSHNEKRIAVDYIIQPFGYTIADVEEVAVREMIVPVCAECAETLQGGDWTLFYCIECCSSHWVYKKFTQDRYKNNILWLRGCPECSEAFGGLYFSDFKAIVSNPMFVSEVSMSDAA